MLIALVATVFFAMAWMTVLRPKPAGGEEAAATQPAAATSPAAATPSAAPPPAETAVTPAVAEPEVANEPEARTAVRSRTTVVLFAADGADDAVARDVVRSVRGKDVRVVVASVADVARHRKLIGTVEILSAPTIVVVGPKGDARRIEGLPDAALVQQAIAATRR